MATKVLILGAAGRDFHDFNVCYRDDPDFHVAAFTAAQIPDIAGRRYPPLLAGALYPDGIPILPESDMERIVRAERVTLVVLAYSDLPHEEVMHKASRALAAGASFTMLGPEDTMLSSSKPVISVGAVRTGVGKSAVSRFVAKHLADRGYRVAVLRHPMPYGDLEAQAMQRFATMTDLDAARCTIEEREEYEPHVKNGAVVYAGVDYAEILRLAEQECDVIVWDGGNNDFPFLHPDLHVVLVDPLRPGHETRYHPGEANLRMADVVIVSKVGSAGREDVEHVTASALAANPRARVHQGDLRIELPEGADLRGRRVAVVEDGPTTTHGGMSYGAGLLAAQRAGAVVADPRPYAVGSIRAAYQQHPHLASVIPALGYSSAQLEDLRLTLDQVPCDLILDASPIDLERALGRRKHPMVNVRYEYDDIDRALEKELLRFEDGMLK